MTAIAVREPAEAQPKLPTIGTGFFDLHSFELTQRVAKSLASSSIVPQIYRGNTPEAVGNCMIAINFAQRVKADPLMVMQNLNVIQGRPSWSSPFLIALINSCGKFTELLFEFSGEKGQDTWGCQASADSKATGRTLVGAEITIKMAKDEGWYGRSGSKWKTMPQQMLIYRAAAFWARVYAPEVSMGLLTQDEAEDIIDLEPSAYREVTPKGRAKSRAAAPANDAATIEADAAYPADPADKIADEPRLDAAQITELLTLATEAGADIDKVCEWAGVTAFANIPASGFERVRKALETKLRQARAAANDSETPEHPALPPEAGQPASEASPQADDAGDQSQPADPIEEAREMGRKACRRGDSMEAIPANIARYSRKKAAWEEGYQSEGELMEAEARQ